MGILDFNFDIKKKREAIVLRFHGHDLLDNPWEELFTCVTPIPAEAINAFMSAVGVDVHGNVIGSLPDMVELFVGIIREHKVVEEADPEDPDKPIRSIVPADDVIRFRALMKDKLRPVGYEELLDTVKTLLAEATGRDFS